MHVLTFQWFLEGGPVISVRDSSFHSSVTMRRMLDALMGDDTPSSGSDCPSASPAALSPASFFLGGDVPGTSVGRRTAGTYRGERRVRSCLACACRCGGRPQGDRGWTGDGWVEELDSELGDVEVCHGEAVGSPRADAGSRDAGEAAVAMNVGGSPDIWPQDQKSGRAVKRGKKISKDRCYDGSIVATGFSSVSGLAWANSIADYQRTRRPSF